MHYMVNSDTQDQALVRQWYAALNAGDVDGALALASPEFQMHMPNSQEPLGTVGARESLQDFRVGFPDLHQAIGQITTDSEMTAAWVTMTGTQTGQLMSITPTGKSIKLSAIVVFRIADGKLAENWVSFDKMELLRQLGVMPTAVET